MDDRYIVYWEVYVQSYQHGVTVAMWGGYLAYCEEKGGWIGD